MYTVFAPDYGSPFVRDLDRGRRYGTIEDFRNLVKLAYMSPHLHHSGGTVCEPVDVPVNKRHFDMVYAHMRYGQAVHGLGDAPGTGARHVEMARILFGADVPRDHAVILSLVNANSPLVWDATMLGAARAYAEANQATLVTPFILAGAMAPVTAAGVCRPDAGRGARRHGLRPARPARRAGRAGLVRELDVDAVGRADVRDAGARARAVRDGRAGPPARRAVPLAAAPVRLEGPRRPGRLRERGDAPARRSSAGVNFVLHAAGWLEGGLAVGYEKFILDARPVRDDGRRS